MCRWAVRMVGVSNRLAYSDGRVSLQPSHGVGGVRLHTTCGERLNSFVHVCMTVIPIVRSGFIGHCDAVLSAGRVRVSFIAYLYGGHWTPFLEWWLVAVDRFLFVE